MDLSEFDRTDAEVLADAAEKTRLAREAYESHDYCTARQKINEIKPSLSAHSLWHTELYFVEALLLRANGDLERAKGAFEVAIRSDEYGYDTERYVIMPGGQEVQYHSNPPDSWEEARVIRQCKAALDQEASGSYDDFAPRAA